MGVLKVLSKVKWNRQRPNSTKCSTVDEQPSSPDLLSTLYRTIHMDADHHVQVFRSHCELFSLFLINLLASDRLTEEVISITPKKRDLHFHALDISPYSLLLCITKDKLNQ